MYRQFRVNPPNIPFRNIFCDYLGPYNVRFAGTKRKVYLLLITCLWSRGINLIICNDMTAKSFLMALQLHSMQYGCPQLFISDSGSNFVAGAAVLSDFLRDKDTLNYFSDNGMKPVEFSQYPPGCNELGGVVESCVKLTKRLVYGAIKNNVLEYFYFLIQQVVHLLNRRPLTFKEALRDGIVHELPSPITAEMLIRGHELVSVNLIPELTQELEEEYVPVASRRYVHESFKKLLNYRQNLIEFYNKNFVSSLFDQGCDTKDRFLPTKHDQPKIGDIVLIKEPLLNLVIFPWLLLERWLKTIWERLLRF